MKHMRTQLKKESKYKGREITLPAKTYVCWCIVWSWRKKRIICN